MPVGPNSRSPGGAAALEQSAQTITTGDVTGEAEKHYLCTIAGLTASRNLTLPVASEAGQRIRVTILDGDADYELIIKGAATVTINSGAAATEWSRLFQAGESVEFISTSTTNWAVSADARIPCSGYMELTTEGDGEGSWVVTRPHNVGGAWTSRKDRGDVIDTSTGSIKARRAGHWHAWGIMKPKDNVADGGGYRCNININENVFSSQYAGASTSAIYVPCHASGEKSAGQTFAISYSAAGGGKGCAANACWFGGHEIL